MEPRTKSSRYRTIHADILGHILDGSWPPGHHIAAETELAVTYGCSRMTVNKALSQLAAEGFIERRRRSGSVVALPRAQSAVLDIQDVAAEVAALGLPHHYSLLASRTRPATENDKEHFGDMEGDLLELRALHLAGEQPFCLEERLINLTAVPEAASTSFADNPPGAWLLAQVPWTEATHDIRAIVATGSTASTLDLAAGAACLEVTRRTWNRTGPITEVRFTYAGTSHTVTARFTPPGN